MSIGQQRVEVLRPNWNRCLMPSSFVWVAPTQSFLCFAMMNLQLRVAGHIGPNRTAARIRIQSLHQWVHVLHNHGKLVVVVAAYPSPHSGTYFWSSFPTHYSCEVLRRAATQKYNHVFCINEVPG